MSPSMDRVKSLSNNSQIHVSQHASPTMSAFNGTGTFQSDNDIIHEIEDAFALNLTPMGPQLIKAQTREDYNDLDVDNIVNEEDDEDIIQMIQTPMNGGITIEGDPIDMNEYEEEGTTEEELGDGCDEFIVDGDSDDGHGNSNAFQTKK